MHVCDSDLELYAFERLNKQKSSVIGSHLTECSTCRARAHDVKLFTDQLATLSQRQGGYTECRREPRFVTDQQAQMQVLTRTGVEFLDCRILDISRHGMKLEVRPFINPGTTVRVSVEDDLVVVGEVRYCLATDNLFHIGILVEDVN